MRIIDMPWGRIEIDTNEVSIVSTVADPPKLRMAATAGLSLGAVSFNYLRPDGRQVEMLLIQGKQDERVRGTSRPAGELTVHVNDGNGEDDANQRHVMTMRHDGVTFHIPILVAAGYRLI